MNREKNRDTDWIIETEDLCYTYEGNDRPSLEQISLRIKRGSRVAIMGGNGSGKSTFFLCLNGILRPDRGKIILDGMTVGYKRKELLEVRKKIGIVFQEPDDQLFSASVFQEISFGILNLGTDEKTAEKEVETVIRELGISPFRDRPAHALSGGQKKIVAIADILVMHPDVMILDEPAAALDTKHRKLVEHIIEELTEKGITVLMATHDMDYAYEWADEIILLHEGKLLKQGDVLSVCMDERTLNQTNLEMPAVLKLYRRLVEKKILDGNDVPPKSMEELERRLAH